MSEPIPHTAHGDERSSGTQRADDPGHGGRGDDAPAVRRGRPAQDEARGGSKPTAERSSRARSAPSDATAAVRRAGPAGRRGRDGADEVHTGRPGPAADGPSTPRRGARAAADDAKGRSPRGGTPHDDSPTRRSRRATDDAGDSSGPTDDRRAKSGTTPARRDRRQEPDEAHDVPAGDGPDQAPDEVRRVGGRWPVAERSLLAGVLGVPPAAAVGVAAALTAIGVAVDLLRSGTLGSVFTVCYLAGCVLATAWVRRRGLFWPMVAPPLLMALAVPVVVLVVGSPRPGAGVAQRLLVVGAPLINGFPMMAWTTGLVLVLGVFRLVTQRSGRDAARAGGRTSTSPRRS